MKRGGLVLLLACACDSAAVPNPSDVDGRDDPFFAGGKSDGELTATELAAVLEVANTSLLVDLDDAARLDRRAAEGIVAHRSGPDGEDGTGDDDPFDDLAELDAVAYVGPVALQRLLEYADLLGLVPEGGEPCLLISEYIEGKMAYNKAVEVYNCGDTTLPLADYSMCLVRNDDTDCTLTTPLGDGELQPGATWVVCRSKRTHFNDPSPALVARCDAEIGSVMINSGDDRMALLHTPNAEGSVTTATVMDALGRFTFRPWWNPWNDIGLRRCTAERNPGTIYYDTADWFTEHGHSQYDDLGVAPVFTCD